MYLINRHIAGPAKQTFNKPKNKKNLKRMND